MTCLFLDSLWFSLCCFFSTLTKLNVHWTVRELQQLHLAPVRQQGEKQVKVSCQDWDSPSSCFCCVLYKLLTTKNTLEYIRIVILLVIFSSVFELGINLYPASSPEGVRQLVVQLSREVFKREKARDRLFFLKERLCDCSFGRSFQKSDCAIALSKRANEQKCAKKSVNFRITLFSLFEKIDCTFSKSAISQPCYLTKQN